MNVIDNPSRNQWPQLCQRPAQDDSALEGTVRQIMARIQQQGDAALYELTHELDGAQLNELAVPEAEWQTAQDDVPDALKAAIELAYENIYRFHKAQAFNVEPIETSPGVICSNKQVPIERVGLYIPGGTAPLFSTVLMLGIPAMLAGCKEVVLCSPPNRDGQLAPAVLYAAQRIGIRSIYKVGGAQAIAAMTYGTKTIPDVYKIFGPGNRYVTKAKELAHQSGVAIDMPAGPSEVLVVADNSSNPAFVAADLLSQAEHGPDSQVMLLSDDTTVVEACLAALANQLNDLPRKAIAEKALSFSKALVFDSLETCMAFSNSYAPEHLILATDRAAVLAERVTAAGSVFLGHYSCESAGDYASGTNHTLPTNGNARSYSGVSLGSFTKTISFQQITPAGIQSLGPAIEVMAEAEGLMAHKNAVTIRLKTFQDG